MEKAELRKLFKQKRKELTKSERALLSQMIADNLLSWKDLNGKNISIFLPIERLLEINTWNIIENLDANFYVPVVNGDSLKIILLESKEQLVVSGWGIPEPTYGEEGDPEKLDAVIVPLLACDGHGNRIGYGAGFYDGFLRSCDPQCEFIGLSFFEPIEKISDVHKADVPLDYCVTPNSIHSFA